MIRYLNAFVIFPLIEKKSGRKIKAKVRELAQFSVLSKDEQDILRRREMVRLLEFCKHSVPYYSDIFARSSLDISKVGNDLKYLQDLPILDKQLIRENYDRLKLPAARHLRKTGGSTGQSTFIYYDDIGLDWTSAINTVAYEMAGNFAYKKDCHISSDLGIEDPSFKNRMIDRIKLFSQNRRRLMIRSFTDEDLKDSFEQLKKIKPFLLQGHPSSAFALATYIRLHQPSSSKSYCTVFEPSGEMLTPKIVDSLVKYLGCRVVNRYGSAEFGVVAHSRPQDDFRKLKVFDRAFYVEEVEKSNIIVTALTNYSFPLIRYDTGDAGTVRDESDGTFIYDLTGRVHDIVTIAGEEYATHYIMDYLDHKVRNIREFQILKNPAGIPKINIVAETKEDEGRIGQELLARWPKGLDIGFISHGELLKVGWQQKFRHVIEL